MKTTHMILFTILLLSRVDALAQERQSVSLEPGVPVQMVSLVDQRHEPVYGEEPYAATCTREVYSHDESVCHTVSDTVCQGGGEVCTTESDSVCNSQGCVEVPRRVCHNTPQTCSEVPRRVCESRAVYVTQYYSCTRYRTVVVGQRLVKTFQHQVEVRVEDPSILAGKRIQVAVNVREAALSVELLSSFPEGLLLHSIEKVRAQDSGDLEQIISRIVLRRGLSADFVRKVESASISGLELGRSGIRLDLPGLAGLESSLRVQIELVRNPKAWLKKTLYRDEVKSSGLGWVSQGSVIRALVPFQKLGVEEISKKRHDLKVGLRLDPESVLNVRDFRAAFDRRIEGELSKVSPSF
jgi:hypothetical protein